jgi:hypothetical protein
MLVSFPLLKLEFFGFFMIPPLLISLWIIPNLPIPYLLVAAPNPSTECCRVLGDFVSVARNLAAARTGASAGCYPADFFRLGSRRQRSGIPFFAGQTPTSFLGIDYAALSAAFGMSPGTPVSRLLPTVPASFWKWPGA